MIPFSWKIVGLAVIIFALIAFGFYLWDRSESGKLEKKLIEAEKEVERLRYEKETKETEWSSREKEYQIRIKSINDSLKKKEFEVRRLEEKIKALQTERENIVIPDAPDEIVDAFRKAGFSSCTKLKK